MIKRKEAVRTEKPVRKGRRDDSNNGCNGGRGGGGDGDDGGSDGGNGDGDGKSGIAFAHLPHQYTSLSTYESIMWISSEGVPAQEAKLIRCKALMLVLLQNELATV